VTAFRLTDERLEFWPPKDENSFYQITNLLEINYEEVWFEFKYFDGFFDATQVQIEGINNTASP